MLELRWTLLPKPRYLQCRCVFVPVSCKYPAAAIWGTPKLSTPMEVSLKYFRLCSSSRPSGERFSPSLDRLCPREKDLRHGSLSAPTFHHTLGHVKISSILIQLPQILAKHTPRATISQNKRASLNFLRWRGLHLMKRASLNLLKEITVQLEMRILELHQIQLLLCLNSLLLVPRN